MVNKIDRKISDGLAAPYWARYIMIVIGMTVRLVIEGIETNIDEQLEIVSDMRFMSGVYDLTFLEGR